MITSANNQQDSRQAAESLLHSADRAIDSTRNQASHALGVAEEKMHNLSNSVKPAFDKLSRMAGDYAHQGMDMAVHAKDRARESLSQYGAVTTRYVADKPVQSVLIAAAVGAAVAILISSARNRNRY